ncbi:MAG TPA: hypothetical protein VG074_07925 [Acidimicrobiales bacterium]|nr:hypothetical protein [Acidimicrobiales bacterium]
MSCTDPDQGKGGSILPTSADPDGPWSPLSPVGVQALFARACFPWWVAGGHALDLFVGHPTRPHADIDVSIFREDAPILHRLLGGWDLHGALAGVLTPWTTSSMDPTTTTTSIWCRTRPGQPWSLQVMFDEGTGAEWVCHRHADIRLPLREVIAHTPSGLPYLRPEIQLLWKAKDTRPKDDADFALVFPLLTREAGQWLMEVLRRHYPQHAWLRKGD